MASQARALDTCLSSIAAEHDRIEQARHRRQTIERAAEEYRRMWKFSGGLICTTFPPLTELEAHQARRNAWDYSQVAGTLKFRELYRAEVAAINAAEEV